MPPVYPPFGSLFLDWSDAPIVVFRRSFGRCVARSVGFRGTFAVHSAISLLPSSYPPSFPSFSLINSLVGRSFGLSVARSVGFCCLSTVLSVIPLLPLSYPSSILTFSSTNSLVGRSFGLSVARSVGFCCLSTVLLVIPLLLLSYLSSILTFSSIDSLVQPGLGPPSYDYVLHAQTFPAGGDVSRRAPPRASDRPYHYLARSFLFWCRVPCAFLSLYFPPAYVFCTLCNLHGMDDYFYYYLFLLPVLL
ncbi:uncharacterized protein G2W53_041978 [Senna tora]|uniref:Uncharacterized protein n=1 Tax=Senna tora TaxID=362788 RepID=A0A834VZ63_9FABA|nr:uncharacterized protein G2W53_041978 [Senna tora]